MNRRQFSRNSLLAGLAAFTGCKNPRGNANGPVTGEDHYVEASRKLPARSYDVVVVGGGTAGVVAALAAARQGAKTVLIESKGYTGGTVVEGGTALHSYYNLWKAFPGTEKKQVVRGIAQEIIDRLMPVGGTTGHCEMDKGFDYDSVCTAIDTELYKLVTLQMLREAGVYTCLNTLCTGAVTENGVVRGVIANSRSGREVFYARSFIDSSAYGDLAAHAGADFTEPNDYAVCNSIGLANVSMDDYHRFLEAHDGITQLARGPRSGDEGNIIRLQGRFAAMPEEFTEQARAIGLSSTTTTVHHNYLMFVKLNMKLDESPTDRDTVSRAELDLRQRQFKAVGLFKKYVPGCENAFIARTSPSLNIRRGRFIRCDYDITNEEVIGGKHFGDDIMAYGYHDFAPRFQVKDGGTYGVPYRALLVKNLENLYAIGMMITSDRDAHMSTRNTVCCMGQGQAAGTAAAMCASKDCSSRELDYTELRSALERDGVYFES